MFKKLFKYFSSVRLAVPLLSVIGFTIIVGTLIENRYGPEFARLIVFKNPWFQFLIFILWLNIFCATISRIPFKKHHIGFITTHLGLLVFLMGVMITSFFGIEGELHIVKGMENEVVGVSDLLLRVIEVKDDHYKTIGSTRIPLFMSEQSESEMSSYSGQLPKGFGIAEFLPFAERKSYLSVSRDSSEAGFGLSFNLESSFFSMVENLHEKSHSFIDFGPVQMQLMNRDLKIENWKPVSGRLILIRFSSSSESVEVELYKDGQLLQSRVAQAGNKIQTPWMDMVLQINEVIPKSVLINEFKLSEMIPGGGPPKAAVKINVNKNNPSFFWLEEGTEKRMNVEGQEILVSLGKNFVRLPFQIKLLDFIKQDYPGTDRAMKFESIIQVQGKDFNVSMNEPFNFIGYTIYQSSYEIKPGLPVVSVFSVNKDPGRIWKYIGSIIIFFGIIIFTISRSSYFFRKRELVD